MIRLDSITRSLKLVLGGTVTANQLPITVSYSDQTATTYLGGTKLTTSNNTTAVEVCSAPAASVVRDIDLISVYNADTAAAVVSVLYNDNGTTSVIILVTLNSGDKLEYIHGYGWKVTDSTGAAKGSGGGGGGVGISGGTSSQNTGTVVFSNSNGVTFGLSNGTMTASVTPGGGGGGVAISGGTSSQSTGTIVFSNSNGVSFGLSNGTITATVTPGAAAGIAALSAGTNQATSGTVVFGSSAGNVTFGMNTAGYVTASAPSGGGGGVQQLNGSTGTMSLAVGSSLSSSTNGSSITFGLASNITTALQSAGAYLTTAAQSNQVVNSLNGSTGQISLNAGSTLSASTNGSSITFGLASNWSTTIMPLGNSTAYQTSVLSNTFLSSQSNQAFSASGGSSAFQTLSFSNMNGVTFTNTAGQVGVTHDLQYTSNTSNITANAFPSANTTKFAGTNTSFGGTNVSGSMTLNSSGLTLSMSVPTGGGGADGVNIVQMGTSNTTGTSYSTISGTVYLQGAGDAFISQNSNSIWISVHDASISLAGNTAGTTNIPDDANGAYWFAGGNNVTLSGSGSTISINADAYNNIAVAGSTAATDATVVFSNSNGVSFGLNGNTLTASVAAGGADGYNAAQFNSPNSTANTTMPILWAGNSNGSGNITLGLTGSTVTGSAPTGGGAGATVSAYVYPPVFQGTLGVNAYAGSELVCHYPVPSALTIDRVAYPILFSIGNSTTVASTANTSAGLTNGLTFYAIIYTKDSGANSNNFNSLASTSATILYQATASYGSASNDTQGISSKWTFPVGTGTSSYSTNYTTTSGTWNINTGNATLMTGLRQLIYPWATSLSEGNYYIGVICSTSSATAGAAIGLNTCRFGSFQHGCVSNYNVYSNFGAAVGASQQYGVGLVSTAGSGTIASFNISNLTSIVSNPQMVLAFHKG